MKQLTCELCDSTDFVKQDGAFVCQGCGTRYTVEEARKIMNGEVSTPTSSPRTVRIDNSDELRNLYQIARRAKNDNNSESAAKYYDMILVKDPTSWEASFYVVYFKAMECKIAHIESAAISVSNCIDTVLFLVQEYVSDPSERTAAYTEIATKVITICTMLYNGAKNHFDGIDSSIKSNYVQEFLDRAFASFRCLYTLGNHLDDIFGDEIAANSLSVSAWKTGIGWHQAVLWRLADQEGNKREILGYCSKIQRYEPDFIAPTFTTTTTTNTTSSSSGCCYVATAVYGSYDCPEVWTLRRFRDNELAKTWYGRAFIHTYYAISPTLVKWFGHTNWFKKMWRGTLDRMVKNLNSKGFESTPYEDQSWT